MHVFVLLEMLIMLVLTAQTTSSHHPTTLCEVVYLQLT
jgi:hypothetical protein